MFFRLLCVLIAVCSAGSCYAQGAELPDMLYYNPVRMVSIQQKDTTNGQPALRVVSKVPLTQAYVEENFYIDTLEEPGKFFPFTAYEEKVDLDNGWNNSHVETKDSQTLENEHMLKSRLVGTIWRLEPRDKLPPGQQFRLKVRNTAPPSPTPSDNADRVENVILYQFKTPKKGTGGFFGQLFDPTTWSACDKDC